MLENVKTGPAALNTHHRAYVVAQETLLLEDLRQNLLLPSVESCIKVLDERRKVTIFIRQKQRWYYVDRIELWSAKFCLKAGTTTLAVHGGRYKTSETGRFFHMSEENCLMCEGPCGRHHILDCKNRTRSLTHYTIHVCELLAFWRIYP